MAEHLTHGWEADTPVSDSLLRQFIEGTAVRGEWLADRTGRAATRAAGVALADLRSPVWFDNTAVLLEPCEHLDKSAVVQAITDAMSTDEPVIVMSAFPTWDLSDEGFELVGHPPFMVRPAGGSAPPLPAGVTLRRVDTEAEQRAFACTLAEAYPMPGAEESPLARVADYDGPLTLFNAYLDGECVATGGTWNSDGLNDVGWISAKTSTRRKGVGAAITWAATLASPDDHAVLIASDDGVGVYERMGYLRLLRLTLWMRPPAS